MYKDFQANKKLVCQALAIFSWLFYPWHINRYRKRLLKQRKGEVSVLPSWHPLSGMDYMDCLVATLEVKEYHMRSQRFSLLVGLILSVFLVTLTTLPAFAYSTISNAPRPLPLCCQHCSRHLQAALVQAEWLFGLPR